MNKTKIIIAFISGCVLTGIGVYKLSFQKNEAMAGKVLELQSEIVTKKNELLGYTKYTDYLYAGKSKLQEQMKFLAARVVREEGFTRVINKSILGLHSDSTVAIWYKAEYSFGYDLNSNSYEITPTATGINVHLKKPVLISSPATTALRHKILSGGMFTNDKTAVINLYEGIEKRTLETGNSMAMDEAVIALCEKKLIAFLQDFLSKQPGVKIVPNITVTYMDSKATKAAPL